MVKFSQQLNLRHSLDKSILPLDKSILPLDILKDLQVAYMVIMFCNSSNIILKQ